MNDEHLNQTQDNEMDELESLFGQTEDEYEKIEKTILTKNLDGFASCFPTWDLHPPVIIREDRTAAHNEKADASHDNSAARRKRG